MITSNASSPLGFLRRFVATLLLLGLFALAGAAQDDLVTLRVEARESASSQSVMHFDASGRLAPGIYSMASDDRVRTTTLQVDRNGVGWFVLDRQAEGEELTFVVRPREAPSDLSVRAEDSGETVSFYQGDHLLARYHAEPGQLPRPDIDPIYARAGFLHPVVTPGGRTITGNYPANHVHHHGIWAAWTSTEFQGRTPDFWNMGDGTGTVLVDSVVAHWSGPVVAGLEAKHRYVDLSAESPVDALLETWIVRAFGISDSDRPATILDVSLVQETAGESSLRLPEYRYGGIGFRGLDEWNGPENAVFLTSEGRDRSDGHATRARWCYFGGLVDGEPAGVAILGHPDNFRAPQPMRIHPDEPFFNYAPSQAGDWEISPGELLVLRYRFVAFDGEPDAEWIDGLWQDYAEGVSVTIE